MKSYRLLPSNRALFCLLWFLTIGETRASGLDNPAWAPWLDLVEAVAAPAPETPAGRSRACSIWPL